MSDDVSTDRSGASAAPALHEIRLLRLPIAVHAAAQEHGAELMREMYLLSQQLHEPNEHHVPARLTALVEALNSQFAGMTTDQEMAIEAAITADAAEIDVIYKLPVEVGAASQALGNLLDEADEFCLQGQHLLTLATPEASVRYRRWYLGEFVAQLAGESPTPWPDYAARG